MNFSKLAISPIKKATLQMIVIIAMLLSWIGASAVNPILDYGVFRLPDKRTYIEAYLFISAEQAQFLKQPNNKFAAALEVTVLFKQNDTIREFDKYTLSSPFAEDSTGISFIDTKRYILPEGSYTAEWTVKDKNNLQNSTTVTQLIAIESPDFSHPQISTVILLDDYQPAPLPNTSEYAKSGYLLTPNIVHFYASATDRLPFYVEIYGASDIASDTLFLLSYALQQEGKSTVVNNLRKIKKQQNQPFTTLLGELNIANVPSGNYELVIELRDRNNKLLAESKALVQRSKKIANDEPIVANTMLNKPPARFTDTLTADRLAYYINGLQYLGKKNEHQYRQNLLKTKNDTLISGYLYQYWLEQQPDNPDAAFTQYAKKLAELERLFATSIYHGYESDRGRIMLQYGAPSDKTMSPNEPGALPYEIWQYYKLNDKQTNVLFVFYNPTKTNNDYVLLHSTARGELKNEHWRTRIFDAVKEQNADFNRPDAIKDHFGTNINNLPNTSSQNKYE